MGKRKILIACVAGLVISAVSAGAAWVLHDLYSYYTHKDLYTKLKSIEYVLDEKFLYDYDKQKLSDYAALGATMALEDPYTVYYSKEEFTDYMDMGSGDFVGIGVTVVFDKENDEIDVISVLEDSPAMLAGMLPGDVIVGVDGERYSGSQMNEVVSKIRGIGLEKVEDTSVVVTVIRDGKEMDVTIVRKRIHEKTVKYEMHSGDVGYIRITSFNRESVGDGISTDSEFAKAVSELSAKGMKKLVIDLRDNGGGDLDVVSEIIDSIVPEGLIMYSMDKYGVRDELKSDAREMNIPMAVLVNGNSASASELMTGALRDYKKAVIVGEKTFGKGVMQQVFPFSDGSGMTITIAKYYTPSGVCVHDEGITPDIVVEPAENLKNYPVSSIDKDEDIQLSTAVDYLNSEN